MATLTDIEHLLIWTYRDQCAAKLERRGVGMLPVERAADGLYVSRVSACGAAAVAEIATLGVRVQGGGAWLSAARISPVAEAVHAQVTALPDSDVRGLVIACAETARRPDWMPYAQPRLVPVTLPDGRRAKIWDGRRWVGCRVRVACRQEQIDAARARYRQWWQALAGLAEQMGVSGPSAPEAPWLDNARAA